MVSHVSLPWDTLGEITVRFFGKSFLRLKYVRILYTYCLEITFNLIYQQRHIILDTIEIFAKFS